MISPLPYEVPYQQELTDIINQQLYASQHLKYLQEAEIAKIEASAIIYDLAKNSKELVSSHKHIHALAEHLAFINAVGNTYGGNVTKMYFDQVMQEAKKVLTELDISHLEVRIKHTPTPNVQPVEYTFPALQPYMYGPQ